MAVLGALAPPGVWADTKVRASSFEYDATGVLVKEVVEPDSPNDCLQTSYTLDAYGNRTGVSTAACAGASGYAISSATTARTASTTYTADGRFPATATNTLGQSETKIYDARFGVVTSLTGPNGLTTTWEYDGFGRKTKETRADGTYTTWSYLLCTASGANCPGLIGGAASVWVAIEQSYATNGAASAPQKRQYHDALNRVVRVQTAGFDGTGVAPTLVQDTEYNNLGQVARASQVYALAGGNPNWTAYTYDALGRVTAQSAPDPDASGGTATTAITYNGLTTTVTNSKNQTKTTTKNAQGQVAQVTDHQGNTVVYSYDALGQLTQTNAAGSITTLTYDQRGRKTGMVDPAMGAWQYAYNAFGELVWQRDSLNRATTMAYDTLGRMTQRTEPDLVSNWSYDKKFDGSTCGKGVGKLCEAKADNGYKRTHSYDTLGRPASTATVLDNPAQPATVSVSYDATTGRVATKTWPTGYSASYEYTATGFLKKVTGGGSGGFTQTVTFEVTAMDAKGHITQYKQGSQVTTVRGYDDATGRLKTITATRNGFASGGVQAHTYSYDSLGNLTTRADNSPGVGTQESFGYDTLNRLNTYTIVGGAINSTQTTQVMYDARGNITYKSDVGRYWYDAQRPNRLTNITLETEPGQITTGTRALTYAFDDDQPGAQSVNGVTVGNGNLMYTVSHDAAHNRHIHRGETYTSFNMPAQFTYSNIINGMPDTPDRLLNFVYGPEHQRIKQQVQLTSNAPTSYSAGVTWYLNGEDGQGLSYEKEIKDSGLTEHKHFVSAGGMVFALFVSRTGTLGGQPATATRYFHHDHLGSTAAISDETGQVIERLAYDPWGKRRYVDGTQDVLDSIVGWNTDRGYTMHEHLDEMGIIHMNGRVYDPLIGRFMSADPFIQAPGNLQSYNRYAYVMNNPLAFTDPSGYSWLSKSWKKVWHSSVGRIAITVAVAYFTGYYDGGIFGAGHAIANGAAGGFAGGLVGSGGNVKAGLIGGVTGAAFGFVGDLGLPSAQAVAAHAAVGCASSALSGGNCGSGALAAGFAQGLGSLAPQFDNVAANIVVRAVIGGTASAIGGGKFENGAVTAAFGYLFNDMGHPREDGWDARSGKGPNDRGQDAENLVRADLESRNFQFIDRQVVANFGDYSRTYDLLMRGADNALYVVESKSTITGFFVDNPRQIAADVDLVRNGAIVTTSRGASFQVRRLIYQGVDFTTNMGAAMSNWRAATIIRQAGGDVSIQRVGPKQ
jgi:RHS repeat-associated protein